LPSLALFSFLCFLLLSCVFFPVFLAAITTQTSYKRPSVISLPTLHFPAARSNKSASAHKQCK
jgi:hypothetical protein